MSNEEYNPVNMIDAIESTNEGLSSAVKLSENMRRRLEKLTRWRIDPAFLEFPEKAPKAEGGFAVVSKAIFYSSTDDARDQVVEPSSGNLKSNDCIAKLEDNEKRQEAGESDEKQKDKGKTRAEEQEEKSDGEESGRPKASDDQVVAVKKMKMGMKTGSEVVEVLGLAFREAEFLVGLSHENVTKLEGFVEDLSKKMIWLVFAWEDNGNLKDFVALRDWEIPERISLINDVTRGVEYLHSREPPIVHGDLESINVLVNSNWRATISDFGSAHYCVAKSANKENVTEKLSSNHMNPHHRSKQLRWAAPEVFREEEANVTSDIRALGCVAYEVMTDLIPFQDVRNNITVIICVVRGDLPSISSDVRMLLVQALCSLVGQCWNIDPCKRPTAEYCRKAIEWMPMIIPSPRCTADDTDSVDRSARLLIALGEMYRGQRDYHNASKCHTQAVEIYKEITNSKGKANALFQLGVMHTFEGQDDRAATYFSQVLEIFTDMGHRKGRALTLSALGGLHLRRNDCCQAVTCYSEGLQIFTEIGDRKERAGALCGLASVHCVQGEYSQAVEHYSECQQISTDVGDSDGRAQSLWGLGTMHQLQTEYSQAIARYSECLQIRTEMGNRDGRAFALGNLAEVYRLQKEFSQAVALFSEFLQIYREIGNRQGIANSV